MSIKKGGKRGKRKLLYIRIKVIKKQSKSEAYQAIAG
jgi:hypothetical protein